MKRTLSILFSLVALLSGSGLPALGYINDSVVSTPFPPEIDSVSFVNNGTFNLTLFNNPSQNNEVFDEIPFETQNTLYFTNRGTLGAYSYFRNYGGATYTQFANTGFRFQYINGDTGARKPAAVIDNNQGATVFGEPYLVFSATNIFNQGTLSVPNFGLLQLNGQNVDGRRGKFDLGAPSLGNGLTDTNGFYPASGVSDGHWGVDTNVINSSTLYSEVNGNTQAKSPRYIVSSGFSSGLISMTLQNPASYVFEQFQGNPKDPTNRIVQVVFLLNANTNATAKVTFLSANNPLLNPLKVPIVQFSGVETNVITGQPVQRSLYLWDRMAFDAGSTLLPNFYSSTFNPSYRPSNYEIFWNKFSGAPSNAVVTTNTFTQFTSPSFTIAPVFQINAGGTTNTLPFVKDAFFTNGLSVATTNAINIVGVATPAPVAAYQSSRKVAGKGNTFGYTFTNLTNASPYIVRLHFADFENTKPSERLFHVDINGANVLTNFDIIGAAGTPNRAIVRDFVKPADATGTLKLVFTATANGAASVNAIEVLAQNGLNYTNNQIPALYSAYLASVDPKPVPSANAITDLTNSTGRLEINAENLNLKDARIRGQGFVNINAKHLLDLSGVQVDAPYLFYNVGSTNGLLQLESLTRAFPKRFASGTIQAWSSIWTNSFDNSVTNVTIDPVAMTTNMDVVVTHYETDYHVFFVKADLTSASSDSVTGLKATSTNTTFTDKISIASSFQLYSDRLTNSGTLQLIGDGINPFNWTVTNVPTLRYLINTGEIDVNGYANFGSDRGLPYELFSNKGTISAIGLTLSTKLFENLGIISSDFEGIGGPLYIQANSATLSGNANQLTSVSADINLVAGDLKIKNATVSSGRSIYLQVTNSLSDAGIGSPSRFISKEGFQMANMPVLERSLLGTTFEVAVNADSTAQVVWPSVDAGAVRNGYSNNAAIGRLVLSVQPGSFVNFSGNGLNQALYIDYLNLSPLIAASLDSYLGVADGFNVYFADSNIPVDQLDNGLGGRLHWVGNFGGPYSGVDAALPNGKTIRVNRNLFISTTVDSDGDGIPNAFDPAPFGGDVGVNVTYKRIAKSIELNWLGSPLTSYRVESTSNLTNPQWQLVSTVDNSEIDMVNLKAVDAVVSETTAKYYRVTFER